MFSAFCLSHISSGKGDVRLSGGDRRRCPLRCLSDGCAQRQGALESGFHSFFLDSFSAYFVAFPRRAPTLGFSTYTVPPWRSSADPHEWCYLHAAAPSSTSS